MLPVYMDHLRVKFVVRGVSDQWRTKSKRGTGFAFGIRPSVAPPGRFSRVDTMSMQYSKRIDHFQRLLVTNSKREKEHPFRVWFPLFLRSILAFLSRIYAVQMISKDL